MLASRGLGFTQSGYTATEFVPTATGSWAPVYEHVDVSRDTDELGFPLTLQPPGFIPTPSIPGVNVPEVEITPKPKQPEQGKQICLFGEPSVDPLIPGICNTTALMAGVVAFAFLFLMSGGRR